MDNELYHYGVGWDDNPPGIGSGRYPHGSGENPGQHPSFRQQVDDLKKRGIVTEEEICKALGLKTQQYRALVSINKAMEMADTKRKVQHYREKGLSTMAIAEKVGISETNVRNYLKENAAARAEATLQLAEELKKSVKEHGYIDLGPGAEIGMKVSAQRLKDVSKYLQMEEGYIISTPKINQMGTGEKTTLKILAAPGTSHKEIRENVDKIYIIDDWEVGTDGISVSSLAKHKPVNITKERILIRYNEEGGVDKDGVMELRPGVQELSLGKSKYAQVRIAADDDRYLKGMAVYGDPKDFPPGVDIIFNTNKHQGTSFKDVLKKQDPKNQLNPFGAAITRQNDWTDENGVKHEGALNIVREEGSWSDYTNRLPSQFLSKQPVALASKQLNLDYEKKSEEYKSYLALDNPVAKKKLLLGFADQCDADAANLQAAAMPRQGHHVILPVPSMKPDEVYAPKFKDGETVVLIRFPHAGRFEIVEAKVNNNNKEAKSFMKGATDAVGISPKAAAQLSGADFDGDTVLVIPNPHITRNAKTGKSEGAIKVDRMIPELREFEPKEVYKGYPGMKEMTKQQTQQEMGKISNLITDMTIQNAPLSDIIPAVKHSMVVIDAEKHKLDWKASERDNNIKALKEKYQQHSDDPTKFGGAQTLISRAKSPVYVPERKPNYSNPINPETGEKNWENTDRMITDKKGKSQPAQSKIKTMETVSDARELMSGPNHVGTPIERVYANYANRMKAMGNAARKEAYSIPKMEWKASAKAEYAAEVSSLNVSLLKAKKNQPRERKAQALANVMYRAEAAEHPEWTKAEKKKYRGKLLTPCREAVGAKKDRIKLSEREIKAMNAGAISPSKQMEIFNNMDAADIKEAFTPRTSRAIPQAKQSRMIALYTAGYTQAQIADFMGVSPSTVARIVKPNE